MDNIKGSDRRPETKQGIEGPKNW